MKKRYIFSVALLAVLCCGCSRVNEVAVPVQASVSLTDEAEATPPQTTQSEDFTQTVLSEVTVFSESEASSAEEQEPTETTSENSCFIELSTYEIELEVGDSKMPIVTMTLDGTDDKSEIWESSDESVAVVDGMGRITAVSVGSCTVKVTSAAVPQAYAEVSVTVCEKAGLTYIDGILIANKTYSLPKDYAPGVDSSAQTAFDKMQSDAYEEGLNIYISSSYRSYDYQEQLYNRYASRDGYAAADRYSARAGHSEHQTGLAFDLNTIDSSFADTDEGKWVAENCYKYGFIVRYPEDKEDITGFLYEPWHIRYLGEETARSVYESGLCLEEYLGIDSVYSE